MNAAAYPTPVLAHAGHTPGIAPLPLLVLASVGAVLAVNAVVGSRQPATPRSTGGPLPSARVPVGQTARVRLPGTTARTLALAAGLWLAATAALAPPARATSVTVSALSQAWLWLAAASLAFGPVWRVVNPFRLLIDGFVRLTGGSELLRPTPAAWGWWPAAGWLLAIGAVAVALPGRSLALLALISVLLLVQVGAGSVFGTGWLDHADPLEVYSQALGALSPLAICRDQSHQRLALRSPRPRLAGMAPTPGTAAVAGALIGWAVTDAIVETELWHGVVFSSVPVLQLTKAGLLVVCALLVAGLAAIVTRSADLGPALLPLIGGWSVSHQLVPWAPVPALAALVAGHLGAMVVAHDRAAARYGPRAGAALLEFRAFVLVLLIAGVTVRFGGV